MGALTLHHLAATITPLLPHVTVGNRSPHKATKGHYKTWFFCIHQKTQHHFVMLGCIEQPLKRLAAPWRYCDLIHSNAQRLAVMGGGYPLLQGHHHAK